MAKIKILSELINRLQQTHLHQYDPWSYSHHSHGSKLSTFLTSDLQIPKSNQFVYINHSWSSLLCRWNYSFTFTRNCNGCMDGQTDRQTENNGLLPLQGRGEECPLWACQFRLDDTLWQFFARSKATTPHLVSSQKDCPSPPHFFCVWVCEIDRQTDRHKRTENGTVCQFWG